MGDLHTLAGADLSLMGDAELAKAYAAAVARLSVLRAELLQRRPSISLGRAQAATLNAYVLEDLVREVAGAPIVTLREAA